MHVQAIPAPTASRAARWRPEQSQSENRMLFWIPTRTWTHKLGNWKQIIIFWRTSVMNQLMKKIFYILFLTDVSLYFRKVWLIQRWETGVQRCSFDCHHSNFTCHGPLIICQRQEPLLQIMAHPTFKIHNDNKYCGYKQLSQHMSMFPSIKIIC